MQDMPLKVQTNDNPPTPPTLPTKVNNPFYTPSQTCTVPVRRHHIIIINPNPSSLPDLPTPRSPFPQPPRPPSLHTLNPLQPVPPYSLLCNNLTIPLSSSFHRCRINLLLPCLLPNAKITSSRNHHRNFRLLWVELQIQLSLGRTVAESRG